jgi:hypothetical protein
MLGAFSGIGNAKLSMLVNLRRARYLKGVKQMFLESMDGLMPREDENINTSIGFKKMEQIFRPLSLPI